MSEPSTTPDQHEGNKNDEKSNRVEAGTETDQDRQANPPTFWQIVMSTLAAAFGVQKRKNLERDFSQQSFFPYIVAGIIFTLLFIASILGIIMLVVKWQGLA